MSHKANNIFKKSQRNKDWKRDGKNTFSNQLMERPEGRAGMDSERTMLQVLVEHHKNLHPAATSARGILVRTRNRTPLSVRFWKCKHCSVIQSEHSKALRWVTSRLARAGNCFGSLENKTRENIEEFHIKTWICGQHEHARRAQRLLLLWMTQEVPVGSSCSHPISADIPNYVDATRSVALPRAPKFCLPGAPQPARQRGQCPHSEGEERRQALTSGTFSFTQTLTDSS